MGSLSRGAQAVGRQLLRWTFWSPWRLGVAVVCVLLLVLVVGQVNRRLGEADPQPSAAPSGPQGLPSGWESWPRVPGQQNGTPARGSTPTPTTGETPVPSPAPTASSPAPTGVGTPAHDNTDTRVAAAGAQKAATGFAREFLSPGTGGDEKKRQADWIKRLTPYLVPALVTDLETVALENVPAGTVTEAQVTSVSDFNATVQLATSAGQMTATMEWSGTAWQVSDYLPPAEG